MVCLLLAALTCQTSPTGNAAPPAGAAPTSREVRQGASAPSRDLSQDEAAGGHTLRKHVGRSDDELRQRLRRERNIAAASTWTDRETAERAVGTALEENRDKIDGWVNRPGGHPTLVIDYNGDSSHPIGRSLRRDADQPETCSRATIVLKWTGANDYYVLTSYPECRL
jgi:Bacterial CdiA-CT RNAse A domain